jgi:hypothetical protein
MILRKSGINGPKTETAIPELFNLQTTFVFQLTVNLFSKPASLKAHKRFSALKKGDFSAISASSR